MDDLVYILLALGMALLMVLRGLFSETESNRETTSDVGHESGWICPKCVVFLTEKGYTAVCVLFKLNIFRRLEDNEGPNTLRILKGIVCDIFNLPNPQPQAIGILEVHRIAVLTRVERKEFLDVRRYRRRVGLHDADFNQFWQSRKDLYRKQVFLRFKYFPNPDE